MEVKYNLVLIFLMAKSHKCFSSSFGGKKPQTNKAQDPVSVIWQKFISLCMCMIPGMLNNLLLHHHALPTHAKFQRGKKKKKNNTTIKKLKNKK